MSRDLSKTSLSVLPGIGQKKSEILKNELQISSIKDLLYFKPRRYIDRSKILKINQIDNFNNEITVIGKVVDKNLIYNFKRKILNVTITDDTGVIIAVFFGGIKYFEKLLAEDEYIIISGKPEYKFNKLQIVHPEFDLISNPEESVNTAAIVPVYPLTEKLRSNYINTRFLRKTVKYVFENYSNDIKDDIDISIIEKYKYENLGKSLHSIHFPQNFKMLYSARRRLAFDEIFAVQYYLNLIKKHKKIISEKKKIQTCDNKLTNHMSKLDFKLTDDQIKVLNEIKKDVYSNGPMARLLQGDVGSGKTVVAVLSMVFYVENNFQAAFLAPTELLAYQNFLNTKKILGDQYNITFLSGSTSAKDKTKIYENLIESKIDILVGTHAIFQDKVNFKNLKYIIIDEQHRFGVEQRASLIKKANDPDLLVMTATPIPRSMALACFGDLDTSFIKTKPANRLPITTMLFNHSRIKGVYNSINKYLKQGRQCYYVLPLIEESEKSDLKSAKKQYVEMKKIFSKYNVELLHGKMTAEDKEQIMNDFKNNEVQILISTTVIEVGIDVPNSNIIVIHNAERFGLSQLHQLRGRVGRGKHKSFCVLIHSENAEESSIERLKYLTENDNGFDISEYDLKTRGAGSLLGERQHGYKSEFKFLNLNEDIDLIKNAKYESEQILSKLEKEEILEKYEKITVFNKKESISDQLEYFS